MPSYQLTGGVLKRAADLVEKNFLTRIDPKSHAEAYAAVHDDYYAEPEFAGKYLDICARMGAEHGLPEAKTNAEIVLKSIMEHQRPDGYLGMLEKGHELNWFSVWNQSFTIYGLTRLYEEFDDEDALKVAIKAGDWIVNTFMDYKNPDILDALNGGSEHISCLYAMGRLYMLSGEERFGTWIAGLMDYLETTDMPLLSFKSIFDLRSKKGIEMLVVYLGVLQYGQLFNDKRAIEAAERYWQEIAATQIRNTGNGTVKELWTEGGNLPRLMPTEEKPNETCVAVGWVELSLALFKECPRAEYPEAIERTLFNHMLGSLEKNGEDFAYYQGNYGRKIYRTAGGMYQCCRYRGFTLFSSMENNLYHYADGVLTPIVYTAGQGQFKGVRVSCETDYPVGKVIRYSVENETEIAFQLRIPAFAETFRVMLDGFVPDFTSCNGFIQLWLMPGRHDVEVTLGYNLIMEKCEIDGKKYASFSYGPLLLAHDTRNGQALWNSFSPDGKPPVQVDPEDTMVCFRSESLTLVDFASAGNKDGSEYTVFIPLNE